MITDCTLLPSYPAPDWRSLEAMLRCLKGVASAFQVDLVDGQFATAQSWPFTEATPAAALAHLQPFTDHFVLELDCMVLAPEQYLDAIATLAPARVIVHYGSSEQFETIVAHAERHDYELGLACTNDQFRAATATVERLIEQVTFVQVMGIATVGAQGQPFDERTLATVAALRERYPDLPIAVDGSVNSDTIPALRTAGVTRFASGSAIVAAPDPVAAYRELLTLACGAA